MLGGSNGPLKDMLVVFKSINWSIKLQRRVCGPPWLWWERRPPQCLSSPPWWDGCRWSMWPPRGRGLWGCDRAWVAYIVHTVHTLYTMYTHCRHTWAAWCLLWTWTGSGRWMRRTEGRAGPGAVTVFLILNFALKNLVKQFCAWHFLSTFVSLSAAARFKPVVTTGSPWNSLHFVYLMLGQSPATNTTSSTR